MRGSGGAAVGVVCGGYEGIDGRVVQAMRARLPVDEVSIGDYVLAGGEAAALVMVEAVGRLLPGVLGNASSAGDDSFGGDPSQADPDMRGLLEGPVYTRPRGGPGRAFRLAAKIWHTEVRCLFKAAAGGPGCLARAGCRRAPRHRPPPRKSLSCIAPSPKSSRPRPGLNSRT